MMCRVLALVRGLGGSLSQSREARFQYNRLVNDALQTHQRAVAPVAGSEAAFPRLGVAHAEYRLWVTIRHEFLDAVRELLAHEGSLVHLFSEVLRRTQENRAMRPLAVVPSGRSR